jgi:hypothetical protein
MTEVDFFSIVWGHSDRIRGKVFGRAGNSDIDSEEFVCCGGATDGGWSEGKANVGGAFGGGRWE